MTIIRELNVSIHGMTADALVNPVNCAGVPGSEVSRMFASRFPQTDRVFRLHCRRSLAEVGQALSLLCPETAGPRMTPACYIIYFPVSPGPGYPSWPEYILLGMESLRREALRLDLQTIAIPALGCAEGLEWREVRPIITEGRSDMNLKVLLAPPQEPRQQLAGGRMRRGRKASRQQAENRPGSIA